MAHLQTCRGRGQIYSHVKNNFVYTLCSFCIPFQQSNQTDTYLKKFSWKSINYFKKSITKPFTHLHPATSTSTQLHPPLPSSTQPPPSSLQHPQPHSNQNIARNWAISPNLGQKIQTCPFWLKIGLHGNLEVLIPIPQNPVLGKFGRKKTKLPVLSIDWYTWYRKDADSFSNISYLIFRLQNSCLGKFGTKKSKLSVLSENWHTWYLKEADF